LLRHQPAPPVPPAEEAQKPISKASNEPVAVAKSETVSLPAEKPAVGSAIIADEKKEKKGEMSTSGRTSEESGKATAEEERKKVLQAAEEKAKREKAQNEIEQLLNQARAFLGLKEYTKAQDTALKVLKREPDNGKAKEIYAQARERKRRMAADSQVAQARAHFAEKKYQLAAEETAAVLKMYPTDPRALELKRKMEDLARREVERKQKIEASLEQAEAALEGKRFTRAKLIAQQVLDVEPENERAKRVIGLADEGQKNKLLQDMVKGLLPSIGGGGMPSPSQGVQNQSGGGKMPSLPLPGLSGQ
jgi:tetratricopeptide (TPR) repeat protein